MGRHSALLYHHSSGRVFIFTGRDAERGELSAWLDRDPDHPLLVVRALGGFGKSALAWHWLHHDVHPRRWPRVAWWSFYEPEATCERFLEETLAYLGVDPRRVPGPRQQVEALLYLLRTPGTLLILDGFERALRAYGSMMAAYQGDEGAGEFGRGGEAGTRGGGDGPRNTQYAIRTTPHRHRLHLPRGRIVPARGRLAAGLRPLRAADQPADAARPGGA